MSDANNHARPPANKYRIPDLQLRDCFTLENSASLAESIGIASAYKRFELTFSLNAAAKAYQTYLYTDAYDRHKDASERLADIRHKALSLSAELDGLDEVTRSLLAKGLTAYRRHYEPNAREMLSLLGAYAYRLVEATSVLKDPRFRPSKAGNVGDLRVLCMELAHTYETYSNRRFTYDYQKGEFISVGSWWVAKAAWIVKPAASSANLATAMRKIPRRINNLQNKRC